MNPGGLVVRIWQLICKLMWWRREMKSTEQAKYVPININEEGEFDDDNEITEEFDIDFAETIHHHRRNAIARECLMAILGATDVYVEPRSMVCEAFELADEFMAQGGE